MEQERKNISRTWFLSFSETNDLFIYFYVIAIVWCKFGDSNLILQCEQIINVAIYIRYTIGSNIVRGYAMSKK